MFSKDINKLFQISYFSEHLWVIADTLMQVVEEIPLPSIFGNLMCMKKQEHNGINRSSRSQMFFKIGVLFHKKAPVLESLFNKVAGLRPATLLKRLWYRLFPVNFVKFLTTPFFKEHLLQLLLTMALSPNILSNNLSL